MTFPTLLVIEDDAVLNRLLVDELKQSGFDVHGSLNWAAGQSAINQFAPELVLLDVNLPDASGLDVLAEIGESRPVVILTATASVHQAVEAMRLGAADYLAKPVNLNELELIIRRVLKNRQIYAEHEYRRTEETMRLGGMLGESAAMTELRRLIEAVAQTDVTVLIQGESGAGKELVAHAVHHASPRREGAFVAVDCCSLQDTLFESELFGHEKGSFTGADRRKSGLIEAADGGTLFLDEIGDIGPAIQAKLLRVLETGRFRRVGATSDLRADARIVAATNRDLAALVREGTFRADLYYRLDAFMLTAPPLRQRRDDIPLLAKHFLAKRATSGPRHINSEAIHCLTEYDWPGNVRELRNVIERALIVAGNAPEITLDHLLGLSARASSGASSNGAGTLRFDDEPTLECIEREYMVWLLEKYQGNRTKVASKLGISERTCYRMVERYGLS
jgi:DNA-binding NtrC family response regulator